MSGTAPGAPGNVAVRQLFDELVDLPADERARRLDALDADQRTAVSALLRGADAGIALLGVPAAEMLQLWREGNALRERLIGRRIGSFEVVEALGEGGSAVVLRARRAAGSAMQVVALKVLRAGVFTAEARWRFAREQAILTQLDHPNIARLIEGGVSDDGLPYFAMELVEGEPITSFADHRALGLRERMALIATLCRAVEAAHSAMVVHRDLKPSNVLVTQEGVVKVLDFGIAKSLDDDAPAHTTQAIMLTPEYAAPEQFRPGPVTSAADVYALGVLLGELLTGRLPAAGATARASALLDEDGDRLPRGLPEPRQLARQLRGDVDAIVATALADEPSRRYRSAGAMAEDLERYLANLPVWAHPPSRWYRARKFVRRHRGGVALTVLLGLGMVTSLVVALWQAGVARQAADRAVVQAARADALRDIMLDAFTQAQPSTPGATDATVVDVVERAVATLRADRQADPRVRIDLLTRLAQVLSARGELQRSSALLRQAQELADAALAADDPLRHELEIAAIFNLVEVGELPAARRRIDILLAALPDTAAAIRASALVESATIAARQNDAGRALAEAERAMAMARALGDSDVTLSTLRTLGSVLLGAGELERAVTVLEESLRVQRERFGEDHVRVAGAEDALGRAYRRLGDLDRAEQHARAAIAIDARAAPDDHAHRSLHMNGLVMVLIERRAFDQAVGLLREIIRIQSTGEVDPANLASNYGSLGQVHGSLGDWPAALESTQRALALLTGHGRENELIGLRVRNNLGFILAMNGDTAGGLAGIDRVLDVLRGQSPPNRELIAAALERKLRIVLDAGDLEAARVMVGEFLDVAKPLRARPLSPGRAGAVHAELLLALGKPGDAWRALEEDGIGPEVDVRVDPVVRAAHALLRLLAAERAAPVGASVDSLRAEAGAALQQLPYPPAYVRRLARVARLESG